MRSLLLASAALLVGLGSGYLLGLRRGGDPAARGPELLEAYTLPVRYGDLGPHLLEVGAIDLDRLADELRMRGTPLSEAQKRRLRDGGRDPIRIDAANATFLLQLFWAFGLTNDNPILTRGPMTSSGLQVGRFASTAGWKLGARPSNELYASAPMVTLDPAEQELLSRVAQAVYRPCCDNPTDFPDCNHGMAMLGMLTVLAAGGATESQMFEAAAAANAVWYPRQYRELRIYFESIQGTGMRDVDPRTLVGREVASGSGFQEVHGSLAAADLLSTAPSPGVSAC